MSAVAATPIIPESAKDYSLSANVQAALSEASEVVYREGLAPEIVVHPLLLCHFFLEGMPAPGEAARELSSALGMGSTESPLFDKVFEVPLPINEGEFGFSASASIDELEAAIAAAREAGSETAEITVNGTGKGLATALNVNNALPSPYKTDIVVFDHADMGTLKITKWHQDDPRGENPHNHPWADADGMSFISYIVRGGYTETITALDGTTTSRDYRAGDLNYARYASFHTVGNILPGTLTVLMCAPRAVVETKGEEWGYLLFEDGQPVRVGMNDSRVKDNSFLSRAAVLNPSLRLALKG